MQIISDHLNWWLFGIAVILGIAVGIRDLGRLNLKRIWAISGVCFDESIRRRILWITPLAILGVIVVSQLQRPLDEQDVIRQTTKFCLFATGVLVAITTIILACTNLPREIENRVIYTVVTKPITRLEIVIGKVVGFAKVSLAILLIMGVFTYAYLQVRAWSMQRYIGQRLSSPEAVPAGMLATLQHYHDAGLLNANKLEQPDDLQIFARDPGETGARRYFNGGEGNVSVPFEPTRRQLSLGGEAGAEPGAAGVLVIARIGYEKKTTAPAATAPTIRAATGPTSLPYYGPYIMSPEERAAIMARNKPSANPVVSIEVLDSHQEFIGAATPLFAGRQLELMDKDHPTDVPALIPANVAAKMANARVYIRVNGQSSDAEYYVEANPITLRVLGPQPGTFSEIQPIPDPRNPSKPHPPILQARTGTFGIQLRGASERAPIGVYAFRDARFDASGDAAPFELRVGVERSGADADESSDEPTRVVVRVRNHGDGVMSEEVRVDPESNRPIFFNLPAAALRGGNFDVLLRCTTKGHHVGLQRTSLSMITHRQTFAWNLAKSLLILWLLAILITAVAIFCSTFLSWPIAVMLTVLMLLGHWAVLQLGDATQPGIGNQIVNDLKLTSPARAKAVSATVEKLSWLLNVFSAVLPDISEFPALEDIERGVAIPPAKLFNAGAVALGFGLPLVLLAYVFLKNKEVAP